jgi:hypothetical protein
MKILKEHKRGKPFKYRKNIVIAIPKPRGGLKCANCCFKNQMTKNGFSVCERKHRCNDEFRSDGEDIVYVKLKKI